MGAAWSEYGYDPERTGSNPTESTLSRSNVSGLTTQWTAGGELDAGGGEPAVADGAVYASEGDSNSILAVSEATGATLWTYPPHGPASEGWSDPVVLGGFVYVGGGSGFYALKADSGKQKWTWTDGGYFGEDPAVVGSTIYAVSERPPSTGGNLSILYALNASTGGDKWSFQPYTTVCQGGVNCTTDYFSDPAVSKGVVYIGVELDASDGTYIDTVYALNATSGATLWSTSAVDGFSYPTIVGNVVYVSSADTVYALNTADGSVKWSSTPDPSDDLCTDPAFANGNVFVGSCAGTLYSLRASNGTKKWGVAATLPSDPTVANGIVYIASGSNLDALNETNGSVLWTFSGGLEYFSPLTILNGRIFVSGANAGSALTAFGLPSGP